MNTYRIRPFGAFRDWIEEGEVSISRPTPITGFEIKEALKDYMKMNHKEFDAFLLIDESSIATDSKVITDLREVVHETSLAILPPVCGG